MNSFFPPSSYVFGVSRSFEQSRLYFVQTLSNVCPNIRFQYWFKGHSSTFYSYDNMLKKHSNMFNVNNEILRTKLLNNSFAEVVLDFDDKDNDNNINNALNIIKTLNKNNIKSSLYYSGGKGVHIHFLFYHDNKLNKYNTKKFNIHLLESLNIDLSLIDLSALSPNVLITCEGYEKRKTQTNYKKIFIDIAKYDTLSKINDFINKNKLNIVLNLDYLSQISILPPNILSSYEETPIKIKKVPNKALKDNIVQKPLKTINKNINKDKINAFLLTFVMLYKKNKITSEHFYPAMVVRFFKSEGLDNKTLIYYFDLFLNKSSCELQGGLNLNNIQRFIDNQQPTIDQRTGKPKVFQLFSKKEKFFDWSEFCELNNINKIVVANGGFVL